MLVPDHYCKTDTILAENRMRFQADVAVVLIRPRARDHGVELVSDGLQDPLVLNFSFQVTFVDGARSSPVSE